MRVPRTPALARTRRGSRIGLESLGGRLLILIKPFLYLLAFGQTAVLVAGVFGLACLLLMTCVRVIAWLPRAASESAWKAKGLGGGGANLQGLKAATDET